MWLTIAKLVSYNNSMDANSDLVNYKLILSRTKRPVCKCGCQSWNTCTACAVCEQTSCNQCGGYLTDNPQDDKLMCSKCLALARIEAAELEAELLEALVPDQPFFSALDAIALESLTVAEFRNSLIAHVAECATCGSIKYTVRFDGTDVAKKDAVCCEEPIYSEAA